MHPFPEQIEAGAALLRPLERADLGDLVAQLGAPETARWMAAIRLPFGPAEAEEILALGQDPARRVRAITCAGRLVGGLGLVPDVWFWLAPEARGRGLMRAALGAAIAAQFARAAPPLLATCRADNAASRAVLAELGFSRRPVGRRMFFASEGGGRPCLEYVLTPEQWLVLHPPALRWGDLALRPAVQKDAPALMQMLPAAGDPAAGLWPRPEALGAFIETHRCRVPGCGLFVAQDAVRGAVGMVLLEAPGQIRASRFLRAEEAARLGATAGPMP